MKNKYCITNDGDHLIVTRLVHTKKKRISGRISLGNSAGLESMTNILKIVEFESIKEKLIPKYKYI